MSGFDGEPIKPEENEVRRVVDEVRRNNLWATRLEVVLVALAGLAVTIAAGSAAYLSSVNRDYQRRIRDCTEPQGVCYQQNQKATAEAVGSIFKYIDDTMRPHRLRNEAENLCNVVALVEVTLTIQGRLPVDVNVVLDHYRHCVTENSGNTPPPPLPENPLATTTTIGGHP